MRISILVRVQYVLKIFDKQDLAVAKVRVVCVLNTRLLQIIRDHYRLLGHL
jgi:hypothetical protein